MKISTLVCYALGAWGAVAMLAGCTGGSQLGQAPMAQTPAPPGTNAVPFDRAPGMPANKIGVTAGGYTDVGRSWIAPDLNLKKKDLLYVTSSDEILVFTYPGGKLVGSTMTGAQGACTSRRSKGNLWVVASGADEILEFAHGGTSPISTLSETAGEPAGCAVDPTTGNLAATILNNGDVVIFAGAKGTGTVMSTPLIEAFFDGYDNKGNLFVDGISRSDAFALVELPKGSSSFEIITLNQSVEFPGGVQWDGKYLAVGDQETSNIYQFAITGTNGTLEGTTPLDGASDVVTFWIQKPNVVGADAGNEDVAIWRYPAGGMPIKIITGDFELPSGVVVSLATK